MAVALDPFESYLKRAADLFEAGDIVQAGQIWQAILKKRPEHEVARAGLYKVKLYFDARATQGGLVGPKPSVEVEDARTTQGALPRPPDPEVTRLLEQGCILYDAGHVEDAVTRWVQVLAKDPDNVLAKGYISGARRTLGQPAPAATPLVATSPAEPPPAAPVASLVAAPALAPTEESDRLLRDGCTLFDMGQLEDALKKWEQILARDPAHALARAYVQDARRELGLPPLAEGARPDAAAAAAPEPNPLSAPDADSERTLIRDGVQLYDLGMIQEAKEKWQQVLALVPGHADAEAYLAMARKDLAVPATVPAVRPVAPVLPPREPQPQAVQPRPMALELVFDEPAAAPEPEPLPQPVTPPSQLTARNQKVRKGLNLPELLRGISLPAWVASPAFILGTIAGLVILVIGSFYFLQHRKDQALKQAVAAFRASAVSPVARSSEIANLEQTPEAIRQEAAPQPHGCRRQPIAGSCQGKPGPGGGLGSLHRRFREAAPWRRSGIRRAHHDDPAEPESGRPDPHRTCQPSQQRHDPGVRLQGAVGRSRNAPAAKPGHVPGGPFLECQTVAPHAHPGDAPEGACPLDPVAELMA